ncbi:MAG TPA: Spy/CpxP family protein refolding chaperone [Zeimonas sp.]|nr:Spy/CpxP family protein refolding chaperone [Zeimonas sp.]
MKPARIAAFTVAGSLALAAPFLVSAQSSSDGPQARPSNVQMKQHAHWRHGGGHHAHGKWAHGKRGHGDRFLRGLDLSDEQRDRIFEIRHATAPKMREQMKVLRETRGEFGRLALSNEYDEAKVRALAERNAQAMSEIAQLRARSMNEIYQVLTPEQQAKLQERQSRRGERRS